jgi:hypothetical protein
MHEAGGGSILSIMLFSSSAGRDSRDAMTLWRESIIDTIIYSVVIDS